MPRRRIAQAAQKATVKKPSSANGSRVSFSSAFRHGCAFAHSTGIESAKGI